MGKIQGRAGSEERGEGELKGLGNGRKKEKLEGGKVEENKKVQVAAAVDSGRNGGGRG